MTPLETLMLELIPQRLSRPTHSMDDGPTEQGRLLEVEREKWQAVRVVADDTVSVVSQQVRSAAWWDNERSEAGPAANGIRPLTEPPDITRRTG